MTDRNQIRAELTKQGGKSSGFVSSRSARDLIFGGVRIGMAGCDADVDDDVLEALFGPLLRAASTEAGGASS